MHIEITLFWFCLLCLQNQFIEKNNDALHASLEFLIQDSKNQLLQRLFADDGKAPAAKTAGKLNFISVGSKFRKQLVVLMDKLKSTVSIVCVTFVVQLQNCIVLIVNRL